MTCGYNLPVGPMAMVLTYLARFYMASGSMRRLFTIGMPMVNH